MLHLGQYDIQYDLSFASKTTQMWIRFLSVFGAGRTPVAGASHICFEVLRGDLSRVNEFVCIV